jgi:hypothetical protein
MVPSWDEIRGKVKRSYGDIESAYEKHVVSAADNVKERPVLNMAIKMSLSAIPIYGPILRDLYDNIGARAKPEEQKAKEILEFLGKLEQQSVEQFDRIAHDLETNRREIIDALNENRISITDLISQSSAEILEKVGDVKRNVDSLLEGLNTPVKVSIDAHIVAGELSLHESPGISYFHRKEDTQLEHAILNREKNYPYCWRTWLG